MGGQGYDLGQVYGKIVLDASGLQDGINKARQSLVSGFANMGNTIQSFGDQMTGLGARITALSAPFSAFAASGVQTASSFDVLMKQIELFGGVTGDELEAVRQTALQLGRDTKFSSQDVGTALLDLLKSGQSLEQALATLPEVLDLAAAGEMSLAQAAGITSSGLAQFRMEATQSERLTNALAQAANASRADVSELGQALANVGPVASQYGLDVEETSAILGVFHNNAIMGAEAGTQLKSMLLNLTRPTDDVQSAYDALGVSLYDSSGNVRDFNEFLLELDSALDALPVQEQNEMMQRLGGSYGIVGLSALRASNGIGDMLAQMRDAPEAGQLAEGFMDTFAGKVESLRGSFETLKIEAFTPFMNDVLAPFVERMIEVVNGITEWVSANPELTKTIIQIGGAIAIAGPVLMGMGFAISNIGVAVRTVTPLLGLLTSPLGLMAGAGLALAHVFDVDLRQAFEDALEVIRPILEGLYVWFVEDALPAINEIIQEVFIPLIQDIGRRMGEVWSVVYPVLVQLYSWFVTTALPAISNFIQTVFIPAVQGIAHIFSEIYETVAPILQYIFTWFVEQGIPIIARIINEIAVPVFETLFDVLGDIWEVVAPALQSFLDWFQSTGWPFIQSIIDNVITPAINWVISLLAGIWEAISPHIENLKEFLEAAFIWIDENVFTHIENVINGFIDIVEGIWTAIQPHLDTLKTTFETAFNWIKTEVFEKIIGPAIQGFIDFVGRVWTDIQPFLEELKRVFDEAFKWIDTYVIQPVVQVIKSIPDAIKEVEDAINRFLSRNLGNKVGETAQNILAPGALTNLQQGITTGNFVEDMRQAGRTVMPGIGGGIIPIPQRDNGGIGLADMPYLIGNSQLNNEALIGNSGKVYIAPETGTFVPNFMDMMNNMMSRDQAPTIGTVVIHANTEEGGRAAARGFVDEFERTLRSKG